MGVNLYGVIHGIRVFIPIMLAQDSDCHVVNTSSMGALIYGPGGLYSVSKHAVVGLSETLHRELADRNAKIKVSVFCPGFVNTRIMDSDRNSPFAKQRNRTGEQHDALAQARRRAVQQGIQPEQAAQILFNGIEEERFYILTHPELKPLIRYRMETILAEGSPAEVK
jgi:NAD(P)-dependent dehydrogenase (short-subunit alcohol dehydrogenase family)